MPKRSNPRFSPETTALERRDLLTSVVKLPFSTSPDPTLNNLGVIVGNLPVKVGTYESVSAFVLQPSPNAKPTPIPVLPGDTYTEANALNDSGQVIGISSSDGSSGPPTQRAFLYSPKSGTVLIPALPGSDSVNPILLSKGGLVAGSDTNSSGGLLDFFTSRGFLYSKHRGTVDLGTLPGLPALLPSAINDQAGLVVGGALGSNPTSSTELIRATFSYNIAHRKLTDLGLPPGFDGFYPQFVDAQGEIAGTASHSNSKDSSSDRVVTHGARTGWKDIGLMRGFDQITLINQMDDGRLLVQVANSKTKATHAAIYQDGNGFRDITALPASFTDQYGYVYAATLTRPNKHGLAIVTSRDTQGVLRIQLLNLKTHALTDITSQIGDARSIGSSNDHPAVINDRNQFLVPISTRGQGTPQDFGGSETEYLVSLDAKGTPVPSSVTKVGALGSPL